MYSKYDCNNYLGDEFCKKKGEMMYQPICWNCDSYQPNLSKVWKDLIVSIGESTGITKVLEWLVRELDEKYKR